MSFRGIPGSVLLAIWLAATVQAGHVVFDEGYQNGWSGVGTVSFDSSVCINAGGSEWQWRNLSNSSGQNLTGLGYFEYEIYFDSAGGGGRVEQHVVAPDGQEWNQTYQFTGPCAVDGEPRSTPIDVSLDSWHTVRLDCGAHSWWATAQSSIRYIKWQCPVNCTSYIRKMRFVQAGNLSPSVEAGENQTITSPVCEVVLNGSVTDDGLPDPPAAVSSTWSMVSGPAAVAFGDISSPSTTATFSAVGTYQLRLAASDGESTGSDTVTVTLEDYSADLNNDGVVDLKDMAYVAQQWLQPGGTPSADIHPAPTADGIVNLPDYSKIAAHWSDSTTSEDYLDGWRMAGANPQRTSWVPEDVGGMRYLEWYKPFEAMISHKVQVVAANNLLYISTTRGLYAINPSTGAQVWVYPTELPLGHSPTVVNGVAYVGCFDRRIHAINASTGAGIWTSMPAGAGFDVNPLVVGGRVVAGNRDGTLYCFNASTGGTMWTHPTDLEQPIVYSCAYNNGVVYFAANDMYAYAVNINTGQRVWKSAKLPGGGFYSWWPVVHGDYVVFTAGNNYRQGAAPTAGGLHGLDDADIWGSIPDMSGYGGAVVSTSPLVLDFSQESSPEGNGPITEYLRTKPWRRTYFLLRQSDGSEVMYDFNNDQQMEYAPQAYLGPGSGSRTPPVVSSDGYEYLVTGGVVGSPYISRGGLCRWELGSPLVRVFVIEAHDEPTILSGGGNQIHYYHAEWRDGTQGSVNIATGQNSSFYWYVYNLVPDITDYLRSRPNDMWDMHGDQNPGIPYNGKIYNQRWGYLLCWSGTESKTLLSQAQIAAPGPSASLPTVETLRTRLAEEVQKMLDAGHLRSGWLNRAGGAGDLERDVSDHFDDYFSLPGDTIGTLCRALNHLPTGMQQDTRDYIAAEFSSYPPDVYAHIGWQGAGREAEDIPPEVTLSDYGPSTTASLGVRGNNGPWLYDFPPHANYALYQYAQVFGNASQLVSRLRSLNPPSDATLIEYPWAHNAYIAGYAGIVGLKGLAGQSDPTAEAELNRLLQLRAANFSVNRPPNPSIPDYYLDRNAAQLTIMRNFMYMTPELAAYLRSNILSTVEAAWADYNTVHPWWFISRACEGAAENNVICPLWDYHTLFQAKAQILQDSYEELVKYLDVPAFYRGDLYYIDNLCAAIEAAE